jgi:hypothetical protein
LIPVGWERRSGLVSNHLDAGYEPQSRYRFGHGLSYGHPVYSDIEMSDTEIPLGAPRTLRAVVRNEAAVEAEEVVHRKGFRGLALHGLDMRPITEPGAFHARSGGSSDVDLLVDFSIIDPATTSPVLVE